MEPPAPTPITATPPTPPPATWREMRAAQREDLAAHGGDRERAGYGAVKWHRFGNWRMTIRPKILRAPLSWFYRQTFLYSRNVYGIELPYTVQLGRRVVFEHQHGIVVHGHCVIGDGCTIRQGVTLGNRTMEQPYDAPILGSDVNVGAGAKILGKVTIGDGANIGANAVVLKDVPSGATAVGVPARILGESGGGR